MSALPKNFIAGAGLLGAALLASGQNRPADSPAKVTKETVATFYQSFHRLTKTAYSVSPALEILCARPSPERLAAEERVKGPHMNARVHFYANPAAAEAVSRKLAAFPEGSIFVKEKLDRNAGGVSGIGGMIKRAPGFDAPHGDWEYFYSDKAGGFTIGKIKSCAECHSGDHTRDGVFRAWQPFK